MPLSGDAQPRRVLLAERTARRVLGALLGNDPPDGEMTLYLSVMTMDDQPGLHRFGLLSPMGELEATVTVKAAARELRARDS